MHISILVGGDRFVIDSDSLSLGTTVFQNFTDFRTFIYANDCILADDVTAKELHLHTASFNSDKSPTFNVHGENGKDGVGGDTSLENGTNGHNFFFSSASFEYKSRFKVNSKGGNGGRGASEPLGGQGGAGGNGGDGGIVNIMYEDNYQLAIDGYDAYDDAVTGADPADPEKAEQEIKEAAKNWVEVLEVVVKDPPQVKTLIDELYAELEKTDEYGHSKITIPLDELKQKVNALKGKLEDKKPGDSMAWELENAIECDGGVPGRGGDGNPPGKGGQRGARGDYNVYNDMDYDAIWDSDELLYHPDQISMTFRDAYAEYFRGAGANGEKNIQRCASLLGQLIQRLGFLDDIDPADSSSKTDSALWKAYYQREADILVLPSGSGKPTTISTLQNVYQQAQLYMAQLRSGQDLYGHSPMWVPRGSFEFYQGQVEDVLRGFDKIESNYELFTKRDFDQKSKLQWIQDGIDSANAAIDKITKHQSTTASLIPPLIASIQSLNEQIPRKKKALIDEINEVIHKINDMHTVPLKEFLSSAVSLVFMPKAAMAAVVAGQVWLNSTRGLTDEAGSLVEKSFIIDRIQEIDDTIEGLKDGITLTDAGSLEPGEAGGPKLAATREALMSLIDQYRNLIKDWKYIVKVFDDYTETVVNRNNQALQYNQYLISWLQDELSIRQQQDTIGGLNRKGLDEIDPELPAVAAFVQQSYYNTVDQVLKLLYMTERALSFWAIDLPLDNFDTIRQGGIEGGGLSASLISLKTNILTVYSDAVENSTSAYQKFGDWGGSGPNVPLVYHLADEEWQSLSAGDEQTSVVMSSAYAGTTLDENVFLGRYDVRLTKVRFFVEGDVQFLDDDGDKVIRVSLRHTGKETIVDPNGIPNEFEHNTLHFSFEYVYPFDPEHPQIITDGIMFDSPVPKKLSYALFGPFTVWDIEISQDLNPNLILSGITGARLEFTGWSKASS
ncbi:hypothetical protein EYB25_002655 [Talaromyces marneffei]|uniref:uncharacterized protein n=1 Tax=Talaromyces marneffei TaxID=37727 RepID=UPI0012A9F7F0|nr:uncharacterized protein EYB26_002669 [Talaromyces marneffei]KAE8554117.1 hypothetical protein EYB25_002655 [Talaromyces marneffei]QGA15013.1 hypothetical protein EYB26_002669 [Talaromyces marneffei]